MQTKVEKCKWCGSGYVVEQNPIYKSGGFGWDHKGRKGYCSDRCKMESEGGGKSHSTQSAQDSSPEAQAEIARINWEREQAKKQEEQKREEETKAKVAELKSQNRPIAAYFAGSDYSFLLFIIPAILIFAAWGVSTMVGVLSTVVAVIGFGFLLYKFVQEYLNRKK